jgi:hypothetical protein
MAALLVATAAVTALYWIIWFADRGLLASDSSPAYYQFENAFPLADGWWVAGLVAGAVALVRRLPLALGALLVAGGAGLYLFGMDVLYDLEHGIWTRGAGGAIEALINVATLMINAGVLIWAWRHRLALLGAVGAPGSDLD